MKEQTKPWYKRWWAITLFIFVGFMILSNILIGNVAKNIVPCSAPYINVGNVCCLDSNSNSICDKDESSQVSNNSNQGNVATIDNSDTQTTTSVQTSTIGEKNALSKAQSYLDNMAFSYSGLINQLKYEGFTTAQATYGADNCGADWNEQAALKAQSYLDNMAFSREGLISQLKYEGFTTAQAEYGAKAVGY